MTENGLEHISKESIGMTCRVLRNCQEEITRLKAELEERKGMNDTTLKKLKMVIREQEHQKICKKLEEWNNSLWTAFDEADNEVVVQKHLSSVMDEIAKYLKKVKK